MTDVITRSFGTITCTTVVSIYDELLRWCITNARERAGIPHEWLVIGWGASDKVKEVCEELGAKLVDFPVEPEPERGTPEYTQWFLKELYKRFNAGYEYAETEWVARMGVDQYFSHAWLAELAVAAEFDKRGVYHTWTCESLVAQNSRHDIRDFGDQWDNFDEARFDQYARNVRTMYSNERRMDAGVAGLHYRHPSRGMQARPDGVTWLQTKALWEEFGPLSDEVNAEGVTGDVSYMDSI